MGKAGPGSLRLTDPARPCAQVIRDPQPRSSRWLSTSIPETQWQESLARTFSAEYNVNNLVSPVLFQEALWQVPENAVVLEIAPHALLQVRVVLEGWWAGQAPWDRAGGQWEPVRGRPSLSLPLQAVLKRGLKTSCTIIPLMKKDHKDNLEFFLSSMGRLYLTGCVPAQPWEAPHQPGHRPALRLSPGSGPLGAGATSAPLPCPPPHPVSAVSRVLGETG